MEIELARLHPARFLPALLSRYDALPVSDRQELLAKLPAFTLAAQIVLCHEERYDGSGYPRALQGDAIPLSARLFAVIDTLDAMTFDRPYRKALPFDTARAEIVRMAGSQFDPVAVETFLREETLLREMTALDYLDAGTSSGSEGVT